MRGREKKRRYEQNEEKEEKTESPQTLRKLCRVRARTLTSVVPPMMLRTSASDTKYYRRYSVYVYTFRGQKQSLLL